MHRSCPIAAQPSIRRSILRKFAAAIVAFAGLALWANAAEAQQDLSELIQQARDSFRPVNGEQLADARAALLSRMAEVERFVRPSTPNGQRWLRYLRWDALEEAISQDGPPDLDAFDATLRRLKRDEKGLELPRFRRLADALQRYRDLVAVSQWENPAEIYGQQLDALQSDLEAYREESTPANETAVGERLRIITDLGQAPEVVAAVRREFARPNAFIDVSTALVAASAEPISRIEPVTDNILGTSIHGDAHTTGHVEVATIPSDDKAVLQFRSRGHVVSQNVGYNGPAVIHSTGHTDFTAVKRVELTDPAFVSHPASAQATTDSDIHSIAKRGGGLGSRMVSSRGWQQARQTRGRADAIASDHAEDRIQRRVNQEINDEVRQARERYEEEYRRPLARRGELPAHVRFSSDQDSFSVEAIQANRGQLGAADAPPPAPEGHDMTMRVHQSAVNNYSSIVLGGATASETRPGEDAQFDVTLPEWMKNAWEQRKTPTGEEQPAGEEPFEAWSMTFRDRPISVEFQEGKVRLTTHVSRLRAGDQTFTDWDITGTYTPELVAGGVVLHREGELVMLPADFRGTLSSRQTAERRNLEEELNERSAQGRGFPNTIEFEPIKPEGALADAGPLQLNEFSSDGGWLVMAWDRAGKGQQMPSHRAVQSTPRSGPRF